jgi:hypothetical protein
VWPPHQSWVITVTSAHAQAVQARTSMGTGRVGQISGHEGNALSLPTRCTRSTVAAHRWRRRRRTPLGSSPSGTHCSRRHAVTARHRTRRLINMSFKSPHDSSSICTNNEHEPGRNTDYRRLSSSRNLA